MGWEIIDYLFFFWVFVTIAVYVFGGIYEKQVRAARLKEQAKQEAKERREARLNLANEWSPYSTETTTTTARNSQNLHQSSPLASSFSPLGYNSNNNNGQACTSYNQYSSIGGDSTNNNNNNANYSTYDSGYSSTRLAGVGGTTSAYGSTYGSAYGDPYGDGGLKQTSLDGGHFSSATSTRRHSSYVSDNSIPIATGMNNDCVEWVNQILYLFYTENQKYGPIITESVYRSMNEKLSNITNSSADYNDLLVEFRGINRDASTRPELTNIRTETESEKSISSICKIYNRRIILDLTIERLQNKQRSSQQQHQSSSDFFISSYDQSHAQSICADYELTLENLEGKLKSVAMLNDKLIVVQFMEKPDTKISLRQKYHSNPEAKNLINEDNLVKVILQTLTQVVVDLYFGDDPDFPQYNKQNQSIYRQKLNLLKGSASELKRQIKHDFFGALSSLDSSGGKVRKVFVKILCAKHINYNQNVTCLLELDQPYQQAISSMKQGSSNPYWDEHFLFNVNDKSNELLLELWDSISEPKSRAAASTSGGSNSDSPSATKKRFGMMSLGVVGGGHNSQDKQQQQATTTTSNKQKWIKSEVTAGGKFLGLARINIDELKRNPVQKLNLPLQSKQVATPGEQQQQQIGSLAMNYLQNSVGGELVVELLFLEHSSSSSAHSAASPASSSSSAAATAAHHHTSSNSPTTTLAASSPGLGGLHKSNSAGSLAYLQKGDIVSVDRKLTPAGYVITTTTITKPSSSSRKSRLQQQQQQFDHQQLSIGQRNQSPISSAATDQSDLLDGISTSASQRYHQQQQQHQHQGLTKSNSANDLNATGAGTGTFSERPHRSRSRSRSILRAIKKRFSFSRNRSRSVGEEAARLRSEAGSPNSMSSSTRNMATHSGGLETGSIDSRSRSSSVISMGQQQSNRAKSMPASRDPNEVPTIVINKSRHSDTASAFTFTHPKSQLVIECTEPKLMPDGTTKQKGLLRHYAITDDQANKSKWRKRGIKLHVFNEHQFVACHLAGSSTCHLCGRVFSRRPGKQGYKCRNCHLLSHKQCHVKVDHNCPYATKDGLKLEYIDADPPACLTAAASTSALSGNTMTGSLPKQTTDITGRPMMRMIGGKSLSMEVDDR